MAGYLLFALTTVSYLALAIFNLQKMNASGDRMVGAAFVVFGLVAAYVVFSLLLTISITSKGGFNWLSSSASTRNILVGVLWLGMIAGVVFCSMLSTEMSTDRTTGFLRIISRPVYYGSIWLPVLMLLPYLLLLNPQWRESLAPGFYKVPLAMACVLGFVIVMIPNIVASMNIKTPKQSDADWKKETLTSSIEKETSVQALLQYTKDEDAWVRDLAAQRLKSLPHYEDELIDILKRTGEYGHYDFQWVYLFLDQNTVDHPDRFVEPINNTIEALAKATQQALAKSSVYSGDLTVLQLDVVCRVLEGQFKESSKIFLPNMLKLQEVLGTPPADPAQMTEDVNDFLKPYQEAVNGWLERNGG